jgi:catechol 2,3-dioxygenase-like lactoylglutathione lyase family enzyme
MGFKQVGELHPRPDSPTPPNMRFYSGDHRGQMHHHDLALVEMPNLPPPTEWSRFGSAMAMHHIAITWSNREAWLKQLAFLQHKGVTFYRRVNHGMTHSVYISDPNGYGIEVLEVEIVRGNRIHLGIALQLNLHVHLIALEGVLVDRPDKDLKPLLVRVASPSDADIAEVVQAISRQIIRKRRRLGYLEAGIDAAVATNSAPLLDNAPELARSMAASVRQRIVWGARAGKQGRRMGSGCGAEGQCPERKGPRCARVNDVALHASTPIPAHRREQLERLMRSTGRGAVSRERLTEDANGDLVDRLNRPWSDGTTGITLAPRER